MFVPKHRHPQSTQLVQIRPRDCTGQKLTQNRTFHPEDAVSQVLNLRLLCGPTLLDFGPTALCLNTREAEYGVRHSLKAHGTCSMGEPSDALCRYSNKV